MEQTREESVVSRSSVVVVGLDGSRASVEALAEACELARARQGEVEAVTVWRSPPGIRNEELAYRRGHEQAVRVQAAAVASLTDQLGGQTSAAPPISGVVVEGDPGELLARAGRGAACIVLGRRGGPGGGPGGATPTVRRCRRLSSCPVLLAASVPQEAEVPTYRDQRP